MTFEDLVCIGRKERYQFECSRGIAQKGDSFLKRLHKAEEVGRRNSSEEKRASLRLRSEAAGTPANCTQGPREGPTEFKDKELVTCSIGSVTGRADIPTGSDRL